jgi:hypothetical protein
MSLSYVISLVLVSLLIIPAIPFFAWKGRPKGFSRLNWMGLVVGAAIFAIVLLAAAPVVGSKLEESAENLHPYPQNSYIAINPETGKKLLWSGGKWEPIPANYARAKRRAELWPQVLDLIAGLFGATAAGSFLAVFFYKTRA